MAPGPLPKDATDEHLVRLSNIITGRNRTEELLPNDHKIVTRLKPYTKFLYRHLAHDQTDQLDTIDWFEKTVKYFSDNPNGQIADFVDASQPEHPKEKGGKFMRDLALACLSYWLTISILYRALDKVEETQQTIRNCVTDLNAPSEQKKPARTEEDIRTGHISAKELVENGRLIPPAGTYTDPLKSINASALNVHQLVKFGRLKVKWTTDISRHLVIDEEDRYLYLFGLPCLFEVQQAFASEPAVKAFQEYVPAQYTDEIRRSYWLLFSSNRKGRIYFKQAVKGDRDFKAGDDQTLEELAIRYNEKDTVWARDKFVHLWPRILDMKSHLDSTQPESWWALLWHDKTQPYVWVPAAISGILFLLALASTGATIAQTWKAFQPAPPSLPSPTGP